MGLVSVMDCLIHRERQRKRMKTFPYKKCPLTLRRLSAAWLKTARV